MRGLFFFSDKNSPPHRMHEILDGTGAKHWSHLDDQLRYEVAVEKSAHTRCFCAGSCASYWSC